ncbi:transglycosylase SLT domain-containing protein [Novosphingobium sp. BL-52-GroH]|uniref:transglycosylase SLT domain-containing protein n=1 Tax=Novosphingobium sp. BL-52-GroH TaxID=3349877 RepID=UPI00384B5B9D
MSVVDTLEFDPQRVRPQGAADTSPAPGFLETAAAGFRYARDDQTGHTDEERRTAYAPIVTALKERGNDPRRYFNPYGAEPVNYDAVWRDVDAARQKDPEAFKEIGDRAKFEAGWRSSFSARQAQDADTMQRGGWGGALAGGLAGSLTDPLNVGSMVLTGGMGGASVAGRMLAEAAINAGVEAIETPLTIAERKKQGRELTGEEIAMNIGFAAAGGAAFKGVEIGAPKALGAAGRAIMGALPTDAQAAVVRVLAKPDFARTPDEAAALHVLMRGGEIDASHPFAATYEGLEAHTARVEGTIAAMSRWPEAGAVQALASARPRIARPAAAGVAPDFDTAWRAVIGIEGGTNRDGSFRTSPAGAIGPAQVMPGTAPEAARLAGLPFDERRYRTDAAYNQQLGQAYYREMLRQFDGDPAKAAAAYNAGPGSTKRGTGVRGAMERARRAGVPDEWVSFLPAETRAYVANFRRRTGMEAGRTIEGGDLAGVDGAPMRPAALDAERPVVDMPDDELAQSVKSPDLPELRRDLFSSETEWRAAQATLDGEAFGVRPALADLAELAPPQPGTVRMWRSGDGANGGWFTSSLNYAQQLVERDGTKLWFADVPREHEAFSGAIDMQGPENGFTFNHEFAAGEVNASRVGSDRTHIPAWVGENAAGVVSMLRERNPRVLTQVEELHAQDFTAKEIAAQTGLDVDTVRDVRLGLSLPEQGKASGSVALAIPGDLEQRAIFEAWRTDRRRLTSGNRDAQVPPAILDEIDADGGIGPAIVDLEAGKVFDDPTGDPVARVADLAWHDAQAAAATRKAPEQLTFDLGDGRGERTMADIEAELKADEDAISTIESCMAPMPAGGAA